MIWTDSIHGTNMSNDPTAENEWMVDGFMSLWPKLASGGQEVNTAMR